MRSNSGEKPLTLRLSALWACLRAFFAAYRAPQCAHSIALGRSGIVERSQRTRMTSGFLSKDAVLSRQVRRASMPELDQMQRRCCNFPTPRSS